jgi:hypothetical protein
MPNKWIPSQSYRAIYERHHGPIPKDEKGRSYHIHHIDHNHSNNHPDNLLAVHPIEHHNHHKIGSTHTEETKQKMSRNRKGKKITSEKHLARLAEYNATRVFTEETRAKISANCKGKHTGPLSEETRAKMYKAHLGKKISPEQRAKMSEAQRRRWATVKLQEAE